jgi:glycosyltransferase involved in cell wall biosynthesis
VRWEGPWRLRPVAVAPGRRRDVGSPAQMSDGRRFSAGGQLRPPPRRLVIYSDAGVAGGHEVMTMRLAQGWLAAGAHLTFAVSRSNGGLRGMVAGLAGGRSTQVAIVSLPFRTRPVQGVRALFLGGRRVEWVARQLRAAAPDAVVVAAGALEAGAVGVLAARAAGIPAIAYIATARSVRCEGRPFAWVRDAVNGSVYYRSLAGAVAISGEQRAELVARGVPRERTAVVENFMDPPGPQPPRDAARARLGIGRRGFVAGLAGRIAFKDKGQDLLARALRGVPIGARDFSLVIAGGGPDEPRLRRLLSAVPGGVPTTWIGWRDDLADFFAAIDVLVIPSRREGVPLVMVEAVLRGVPVVASAVDGMAAWLPPGWLFRVGDPHGMLDALGRARSPGVLGELQRAQVRFRRVFLRRTGPREFLDAVANFLQLGPPAAAGRKAAFFSVRRPSALRGWPGGRRSGSR